MGVVGAAIKGFGKALKVAKRNKASEQVFKNPKYKPSQKALKEAMSKGVVDRNVKSKEVFKIIKGLKKKPKGKFSTFPSEIVRTLKSKKSKAFGKGALIGGAAASGVEYKRRKDRGDYKE